MLRYPAICFTVGPDYKFVYPADIIHIDAEGSYSHVHIKGGSKLILSKNLKELEAILPEDIFIRVHHSYIINLIYVIKFNQDENSEIELSDGTHIPLSRRKKSSFLEKFIKI